MARHAAATHSGLSWLVPAAVLLAAVVALAVDILAPARAAAAMVGLIFLVLFLQRPDIGLLLVLVLRGFSDAIVAGAGAGAQTSATLGTVLSSPVNIGLILMVVLCGGMFLIRRGLPIFQLPGGLAFTVLLLVGLIGVWRAPSRLFGLDQWSRAVTSLVVYGLAAYALARPQHIRRVVPVLAVAFVIPALVGFYQLVSRRGMPEPGLNVNRVYGTFVHPNPFGFFLVILFAVFLCQVLVQRGGRRLIALGIVAASAILLLATYTRDAWIGAIVVLVVIGALRKPVLLLLLPIGAAFILVAAPSVSGRLGNFWGGSFADRVGIWQATYPQWLAETRDDTSSLATGENRLIGTGPGSVEFLTRAGYGTAYAAHNDYLRVLIEYGIVGLVSYVILFAALLRSTYRTWRRCASPEFRALALSFLALIPAFLVMSMTDNIFAGTQNQVYFWTLAGITAAIGRLKQPVSSAEAAPLSQPGSPGSALWPRRSAPARRFSQAATTRA